MVPILGVGVVSEHFISHFSTICEIYVSKGEVCFGGQLGSSQTHSFWTLCVIWSEVEIIKVKEIWAKKATKYENHEFDGNNIMMRDQCNYYDNDSL